MITTRGFSIIASVIMDLFSLLLSKNLDHIFDLIFSYTGSLTLVNLSQTSLTLRGIVTGNRIAWEKIQRWRRMIKKSPRMKTFPVLTDNSLVPCMMAREDVVMYAELGAGTSVNIFSLSQERITARVIVEPDFPLPVYQIDFNEDIIAIVAADHEELWNNLDRRRTVRLFSRQTKLLLSEFQPQDVALKLILHCELLLTLSSRDVVISSLRRPMSPKIKAILDDHRDTVVDMALEKGRLLTLSHSCLFVRNLDTLVSLNKISLRERCRSVALSWPIAAVSSDAKIELLNLNNSRVLRELRFPNQSDSLDIRHGYLLARGDFLRLWSLDDVLDSHEDAEGVTHQTIWNGNVDNASGVVMMKRNAIFVIGWNSHKVLLEF